MEMLTIEYLIAIKQEDDFCKDENSYVNFLCVDDTIKIANDGLVRTIVDKSSGFVAYFDVVIESIPTKEERIFDVRLQSKDESKIKELNSLARKIKKISLKINSEKTRIHTIQNDIGTHFAIQAYPIIHKVENSLRRLISKFMILKIGTDWFHFSVNDEIVNGSNKIKLGKLTDFLYDLDFIDLSDVLFKPYRGISVSKFEKIISRAKNKDDLDFKLISDFVPKSNWERHFSKIVKIDENTLMRNWSQLYELRNKVAHNHYLDQGDFDKLNSLVNGVQPILEKAYENIDRVRLSSIDKELITKVVNINSKYNNKPRVLAAAKEFNIGRYTLIEFLESKGFRIDGLKPTSRLTEEMYNELDKEFVRYQDQNIVNVTNYKKAQNFTEQVLPLIEKSLNNKEK